MKKYILNVVVFICGASTMILELVASRILAPFVGTSSYVWTSLIGVILGSMSLGYWLGGKLADKEPKNTILSAVIFSAGVFIGTATFINIPILQVITTYIKDLRISAIISTLILFAPPSTLLGMVSPYAVKLKIADIDKSGATVGNLYALSTLGSIFGTFLAGFICIPFFGSEKNLLILGTILVLTSFMVYFDKENKIKGAFLTILIASLLLSNPAMILMGNANLMDIDTEYSRVWIYPSVDKDTQKDMQVMQISNEYSSAMFINNDDLVFDYTKYYRLAEYFNPNFKNALMIGGAAYSFPKYFIKKYPNAKLDVVEIDPKVTGIAKNYFRLVDNQNLNIFHEDGRIFLNRTKNKYDVIYGDAFRAKSVPYQLTTKEAAEKMYASLNENGVVLINLISGIEGDAGKFLRAEYATYKSVFPQVYIFAVNGNGTEIQNIMLVASKSKSPKTIASNDAELNGYLQHLWSKQIKNDMPILKDDYAPVEYYIAKYN